MFKLFLTFALIGTCHAGTIKVLGPTSHTQIVGEIPTEEYSQLIVMTKKALDEHVAVNLLQYENKGTHWRLQKFSLGLGVNGEIGIGPFKFAKALKQRYVYSR